VTGWIPGDGTFGARLALIRQRVGWGNVAEAARACGIPTETWRTWESRTDDSLPRKAVESCRQIAAVTGVDAGWLLTGHPSADPSKSHESDKNLYLTQVDLWA
jgi:hypothetical protein